MSCTSKPTMRVRKWQVTVRTNGHIFRESERRRYGKSCCAVCHVKFDTPLEAEVSCTKCRETLHRNCLHLCPNSCTDRRAADERSWDIQAELYSNRSSLEMVAAAALVSIADDLMPAIEEPSGGAAEAAVGCVPDDYTAAFGEGCSVVPNTVIVAADRSASATDRPVPVALVVAHGGRSDEAGEDAMHGTIIVSNNCGANVAEAALGVAPEEPPVPDNERYRYVQEDMGSIQEGIRDVYGEVGVLADAMVSIPENPPEEAVPIVGEKIGCALEDFELIEEVGCGSYGKVVTALLKGTNQIYALKAMEKCTVKPPLGLRRIHTERRVFARCTGHPFLVGLLACMQTRTHLIFVMEFASGGDLLHRLEQMGSLPVNHVRFYAAEIALALGYLHDGGIIHRDLKPENVLFDREGHVKVTDYGLSRDGLGENERTNTFCGTVLYTAPEVILGQPYGPSADWWSFGIIVYEMLFGFSPFDHVRRRDTDSGNPDEYIHQAIVAPVSVSVPDGIGLPAVALLESLLSKMPCCRLCCTYGVRELFTHPFFEDVDFEQVEWREVPPPVVPPSPWKLTERISSGGDDIDDENRDVAVPNFETIYPQETDNIDQSLFEDFDYADNSMLVR